MKEGEKMSKAGYREKINSLDDLKKEGLCLIEDDIVVVENRISKVLEEKKLLVADLAKLTGISRQNINAVIHKRMKPGIDFALKISYVLGVPVEELFSLTEDAWVIPYKYDRDTTLYLDIVNMEKVDAKEKRRAINETGYEYVNVETGELITKEERDARLREYIEKHFAEKEKEIREEDDTLSTNQVRSIATEELRKEFNQMYSKIYKKIGKKIEPYVV